MWNIRVIALTLAAYSTLASAAIFPKDTVVKMLDPKGFRKAMKNNETTMVAFVAPWCGHCQRMAPEYSKAALGLYPLIPTYAVDCDADANKRLCNDQGVQGFPTIKLYPRGKQLNPLTYDSGDRTASSFFYWASRRVPNHIKKIGQLDDIQQWVQESAERGLPRALLLTQEKIIPLLWTVLGNKYAGKMELASHRDRKGKSSVAMGYEAGEQKSSKVLIYAPNSTIPVRYEGINKLDSLSKFFESVIDGTADLKIVNEEAASEEFVPDEAELEIERKQEAQRIALAHGGFANFIDFEDAIKKGHNPHGAQGYPGMLGDLPKKKATGSDSKAAEPAAETREDKGQAAFAASPAEEPAPTATPTPEPLEVPVETQASEPEPASAPKDEL
ncbi:hypothetical protein J3R30DRAFT_3505018 [Lentinula aciculospora]|uniref:Thioredoxin domain-containing protein n=1 Tax=Lentinula aciculospora TaxID=153920 RepID=A0A9W9DLQ6_9AGAR|nr:hypothetical protein J3R30DRAFT_3505018 [Lentinula aciculospora]